MNNIVSEYQNILVIDTATEACSAAILKGSETYHHFEVCPQQQSQRILPMISDLCQQANIKIQQVEAIGFGHGPGSFTGVRIAIGTVQGLALGLNIPVVGVSTLAAMAQQAILESENVSEVLVAIDARMGEVYFGHYRRCSSKPAEVELVSVESVMSPTVAAEYATNFPLAAKAGTGWQAYPDLQSVICNLEPSIILPNAHFMIQETIAKLEKQQVDSADTATPVYLRDTVTWKKLPGRE